MSRACATKSAYALGQPANRVAHSIVGVVAKNGVSAARRSLPADDKDRANSDRNDSVRVLSHPDHDFSAAVTDDGGPAGPLSIYRKGAGA